MYYKSAPIPPACSAVFTGGIDHPDLWLWDSWTLREPGGVLNLYCLALSKRGEDGSNITPPQRNDFTFHVRRFVSSDNGRSWRDKGAVMERGGVADGADARNVWSGSVLRLDEDTVAFGFTGVRHQGTDHRFLQTICVATGPTPAGPTSWPGSALSCPLRDHDAILTAGYYLSPLRELGSNDGEAGGPIMAWRDPFLVQLPSGDLHAVWSAKVSPTIPAIAHARLERNGDEIGLAELYPPMLLPDAHLMTQAEVPKIYRDPASGDYLLLISACDRRFEGQPDRELTHIHRLYRSAEIGGPWRPFQPNGSALAGLEGLFGASLIDHDACRGRLTVLGPFTENAGSQRQLRFAEPIDLQIPSAESRVRSELA